MQFPLYNQDAQEIRKIELSDSLFNVPLNQDLLFHVVTALMSNQRQTLAHAKGRSEVRGGGKKPWQQKGTGRARHGSIRSPIWKGGGVTHGPKKEKDYHKKINRKAARRALAIALSEKTRDGQLLVVDEVMSSEKKTKNMAAVMRRLATLLPGYVATKQRNSSILLVTSTGEPNDIYRTAKNIPHVRVEKANELNALKVLSSKYVVLLERAMENIQKPAKRT